MVRITRKIWKEIMGDMKSHSDDSVEPSGNTRCAYTHGETQIRFDVDESHRYILMADGGRWNFDYIQAYEGRDTATFRFFIIDWESINCTGELNFEYDDRDEYSIVYNPCMLQWIEDKGLTYTEARRYLMSTRGLSADKIAEAEGRSASRGAVALSINSAKVKLSTSK